MTALRGHAADVVEVRDVGRVPPVSRPSTYGPANRRWSLFSRGFVDPRQKARGTRLAKPLVLQAFVPGGSRLPLAPLTIPSTQEQTP